MISFPVVQIGLHKYSGTHTLTGDWENFHFPQPCDRAFTSRVADAENGNSPKLTCGIMSIRVFMKSGLGDWKVYHEDFWDSIRNLGTKDKMFLYFQCIINLADDRVYSLPEDGECEHRPPVLRHHLMEQREGHTERIVCTRG